MLTQLLGLLEWGDSLCDWHTETGAWNRCLSTEKVLKPYLVLYLCYEIYVIYVFMLWDTWVYSDRSDQWTLSYFYWFDREPRNSLYLDKMTNFRRKLYPLEKSYPSCSSSEQIYVVGLRTRFLRHLPLSFAHLLNSLHLSHHHPFYLVSYWTGLRVVILTFGFRPTYDAGHLARWVEPFFPLLP